MESNYGTHPLFIDLVISKIFSSLKTQEIKTCRRVCSNWSIIGYQMLLPRCKDDILFGDSTRSKDLEEFTKVVKFNAKVPFKSFTIQPSTFALKRSQPLEEFFFHSAHLIQSLFLAYLDHSHHKTLFTKNFLHFKELPNLSHLRFQVLEFTSGDNSYARTLGAEELFESIFFAAKNLVRLELVISSDNLQGSSPYLQTIGSSCQEIHSKLKQFVLNAPLNDLNLVELTNLDFQFDTLHIKFKDSPFMYHSPTTFLKVQSSSLKKLKINPWTSFYYNNSSTSMIEELPCLKKLEELEVLEWKTFSDKKSSLPFQFSYAKNFPCLKKLTFQSHYWQEFFIQFFPKDKTVESLKELKLPKNIGIDSSLLVRRISTSFPSLVKLEIAVSSESVHCLNDIFSLITHLEDLTISFINWDGSKCIDYLFTGIAENICKQIYSVSDVSTADLSSVYIGPSISNLKGLRRLQLRNMSMFSQKGRPQYTDITAYHGLLNLKRLSSLSIWPSQMSKTCIKELKKRFKVTLHSF